MKNLALLAIAALVAVAAPAAAQSTIDLEAHDVYFTLAGSEERNPTLTVEPGEEVTVTLANVGVQPHNFQVKTLAGAEIACCIMGGNSGNVTFTAPAEPGTYTYICLPHEAQGMKGTFQVGAPADDGATDDGATDDGAADDTTDDEPTTTADQETPGLGVLGLAVALAAAVLLVRRH